MADLQNTVVNGTLVYRRAINSQSANYTLQLSDIGKVVEFSNSSPALVTVPPNSSVAFPIGTVIYLCSVGSASLQLTPGSGVTLSRQGGFGQFEEIYIRKRDTDAWITVDSPSNLFGTGSVTPTSANGFQQFTYTSVGSSNTFTVG